MTSLITARRPARPDHCPAVDRLLTRRSIPHRRTCTRATLARPVRGRRA